MTSLKAMAKAGLAEPARRRAVDLAESSKISACLSVGMPMPVSDGELQTDAFRRASRVRTTQTCDPARCT
jgi:hypothetical protein